MPLFSLQGQHTNSHQPKSDTVPQKLRIQPASYQQSCTKGQQSDPSRRFLRHIKIHPLHLLMQGVLKYELSFVAIHSFFASCKNFG